MQELIERGFFKTKPIKLSDSKKGAPADSNPVVQVLRTGKFNHPKYGEFEITKVMLQELIDNFDANVRGCDLALDYFHKSDEEAAGWFEELYLSEDGEELWAKVDWTKKAMMKLSDREIRYFSPDFAFKWTDPESGKEYENVLFGGGLTNRPFVKEMAAIVAAEQKEEDMKLEELTKTVAKLSEDSKAYAEKMDAMSKENADMKKKLAEMGDASSDDNKEVGSDETSDEDDNDPVSLKKKLSEAKAKLAEAEANKKKLEDSAKMAERVSKFNVMLTEGKACAAQKDAFIKGDMEEFVKLSQLVNLAGKGTSSDGGKQNVDDAVGDRDDKVLKLAEAKIKENPKLDMVAAITLANKEIK